MRSTSHEGCLSTDILVRTSYDGQWHHHLPNEGIRGRGVEEICAYHTVLMDMNLHKRHSLGVCQRVPVETADMSFLTGILDTVRSPSACTPHTQAVSTCAVHSRRAGKHRFNRVKPSSTSGRDHDNQTRHDAQKGNSVEKGLSSWHYR